MTLFFKRLRQKLLIQKKFGKYLLYVFGEIMIVIIGILVAVEVNNRNERRQDRAIEISILKTIKADIERDLQNLQWDIDLHEEVMASSRIIQDHLENNLPYNDSLPYHFLTSFLVSNWMYNSGGIQSLKSLGVNTVTNEEIRSQIIQLYDFRYEYMGYLTTTMNDSYSFGVQNILLGRFEEAAYFDDFETEKLWDGGMIPLDYEGLINDDKYKFHLKSFYNGTAYYLMECDSTKNMVSRAIMNLEKEIKSFEN